MYLQYMYVENCNNIKKKKRVGSGGVIAYYKLSIVLIITT